MKVPESGMPEETYWESLFDIPVIYDLAASLWWALPLAVVLAALQQWWFERKFAHVLAHGGVFLIIYLLLFGAMAEWLFWDEFRARFNFIAVDYLVYTTEVIGNIRESYSLPAVFGGLLVLSALVYSGLLATGCLQHWLRHAQDRAAKRWRAALVWCAAALTLGLGLNERMLPQFSNSYNGELAKNGLWSLFAAFRANELEFDKFYVTLPVDKAFLRVTRQLHFQGGGKPDAEARDLLRVVENAGPERRLNVIQITVESFSASFMARYGNTRALTPSLDRLAREALVFDRFYATGTRIDRGMEALTLSVPPTPGVHSSRGPRTVDFSRWAWCFGAKATIRRSSMAGSATLIT